MMTRMFHILLAFQLFASSVGMVVNLHFCRDTLQSAALFLKPPSCHELPNHPSTGGKTCPRHAPQKSGCCSSNQQSENGGCCDDTSHYVKVEQEQDFHFESLKDLTVNCYRSLAIVSSHLSHDTHYEGGMSSWLKFRPPLIEGKGILVLFQIFRL